MKWLFGKTMIGAFVGAATVLMQYGISVQGITGAVAVILTAAGVRSAIAKNGNNE